MASHRLARNLGAEQEYELVPVSVRAGQIEGALRDVAGCGKHGTVVVVGNNLQGHAEQAAVVGAQRLVPFFEPRTETPLLADGSRRLRLRLW